MEVVFDVSKPIVPQAIASFHALEMNGEYTMNPEVGHGGTIRHYDFPGGLEFYHFGRTTYRIPIEMRSFNPPDSPWLIIHINLSDVLQQKRIGDRLIEFHKYHPAAILLYGPGLDIETYFAPGTEAEVCGMRLHRDLLENYFGSIIDEVALDKPLTLEDLDPGLEQLLLEALDAMENKLTAHSRVLEFLGGYINKLRRHDRILQPKDLHSSDYRNLMKVSSLLRNPVAEEVPSLAELASLAEMSITKFKITFKQVFGSAPKQYQNKIRMEYAREQLRKSRKSPTELSYELGYSHPSNFTAAYKKFFDALPSNEGG